MLALAATLALIRITAELDGMAVAIAVVAVAPAATLAAATQAAMRAAPIRTTAEQRHELLLLR